MTLFATTTTASPSGARPGNQEIRLGNGRVTATLWSHGATLAAVTAHTREGDVELLVHPDAVTIAPQQEPVYVGSTLGRFARLVSYGRTTIDGEVVHLLPNAGSHHVHGGPEGFDGRTWRARAGIHRNRARAELELRSPDGDQGYPGELLTRAVVELDDDDALTISYFAVCDRPTLFGLSPHAFWNLGRPTIDDLVLEVSAQHRVEQSDDFVPTGRLLPLADALPGPGSRIGDRPVDLCLAWPSPATRPPTLRLSDPAARRALVVSTDQTAMALYSGDHLPGAGRSGLCIQPGPWPDAPNRPEFPTSTLRPGQVHRSTSRFQLQLNDDDPEATR